MKKLVIALVVVLIAGWGLAVLTKQKIGDLRPALLPIRDRAANTADKKGSSLDFPLQVPAGFEISVFARNLNAPRDLEFTEGGILLASVMREGRVVALSDKDTDGQADETKVVLEGLDNPHGLAFRDSKLFVAEERRVVRYSWNESSLTATEDKELFALPAGGRHVTRSLAFDKKGNLYVSIGSTCDVCFEKDPLIGTVLVSDAEGKTPRIFSKGLRNAVFITADPSGNTVWATEMGRDFLGDETPPDEINVLKDGGHFGWPVCYGDKTYDREFGQRDVSYCADTQLPAYKIPAHSAPLGLAFVASDQFPRDWQGDLVVGYHGSWNRSAPAGYKVVRMHVEGARVTHEEDFITGFLQGAQAQGRPADVIFDKEGSLYVSDDKAGVVYLVTYK